MSAQRSLPAPHTERVQAGERAAESWILSLCSPREAPQAVIVLNRPTVNSAEFLLWKALPRESPPRFH